MNPAQLAKLTRIIQNQSYKSNAVDLEFFLNALHSPANLPQIQPLLTSVSHFAAANDRNVWLLFPKQCLQGMTALQSELYSNNFSEFYALAMWWTCPNGEWVNLNAHKARLLTQVELMIKEATELLAHTIDDENPNVKRRLATSQILLELVNHCFTTLVCNSNLSSKHRAGCKEILEVFAQHFVSVRWVLLLMARNIFISTSSIGPQFFADRAKEKLIASYQKSIQGADELHYAHNFPLVNQVLNRRGSQAVEDPLDLNMLNGFSMIVVDSIEHFILQNLNQFNLDPRVIDVPYPSGKRKITWKQLDCLGKTDGLFQVQTTPGAVAVTAMPMSESTSTNSTPASQPSAQSCENQVAVKQSPIVANIHDDYCHLSALPDVPDDELSAHSIPIFP